MTDPVRQKAALSPAPRHLRKRRFRAEVRISSIAGYGSPDRPRKVAPATLATGAAAPVTPAVVPAPAASAPSSPLTIRSYGFRKASLRQKRLIALLAVILVSITIPVLALTLMFAR
ncbi:hypothetical protein ACIQTZ_07520 [Paenarthrobacter sp. NPDC090520]|uniref:hypothetical protein n=1 Tax=Paenarthrobacter sp. NPDC090520 TaxID=3364382 RepID=UPI0038224747